MVIIVRKCFGGNNVESSGIIFRTNPSVASYRTYPDEIINCSAKFTGDYCAFTNIKTG